MIVQEFEDEYSNFFYNKTITNNSKVGIFDRPSLKHNYSNTLKDDIDEFIHVLNNNKNTNKHIQNTSESVIKKPLLTDMVDVSNLKTTKNKSFTNFGYDKDIHLILKDDLFNIENDDSNFIFLSPESDIDANNLFSNDLNTQNNLTVSSKANSFKKQDSFAQYRYIVPVEKFYSYNDAVAGGGRPKTAKKLIDSPKTENTQNSDLAFDSSSAKQYTHLPGGSNGGSEHQETGNKSMWILKVRLWINKLKHRKRHNKKMEKNQSLKLITKNPEGLLFEMYNTTFKNLDQYSKFFVNEQGYSIGESFVLKHTPRNSTNMILRQTSFDDSMTKIHHQHYLFLNFLSPINCSLCLRYVKENNLEEELKKSRYFHLYETIEKEININMGNLSEEKVYQSSLFNFWHGIKREISFKLKKTDCKSIETIGSLKSAKEVTKQDSFEPITKNRYYKPRGYEPLTHKELKRLTKMLLKSNKNLRVVENNITKYPMLKDKSNETKNKEIILMMTDGVFEKRLYLWNLWFWKSVANGVLNSNCNIKCNKCNRTILSSMETILFRNKYSFYNDRLCQRCLLVFDDVKGYISGIIGAKSLPAKCNSDETLLPGGIISESHLEDEQYFEVEGFHDVVSFVPS